MNKSVILFVDDEPEVLEAIKRQLRKSSFTTHYATNAKDALDILDNNEVDIIVSDMRMPNMSGVDFLTYVSNIMPEIIRIVLTGYSDIKSTIDAINYGKIYGYVVKPWDRNELISLLNEASQYKKEQDAQKENYENALRRGDELEKSNDILQKLTSLDPLTGLDNRRSLSEKIDKEYNRTRRTSENLSLAIVDIDHFKKYNDNYGHAAGDECLRKVSNALKMSLSRPGDFVARYGGEEFVFIMPNTDSSGAKTVAENILKNIARLTIPHDYSEHKRISVSIGISTLDKAHTLSKDELFEEADKALYRAKETGRNKYILCDYEQAEMPNEDMFFLEENNDDIEAKQGECCILVVDDEEDIHAVTRMVLGSYTPKGKKIRLISAYSGKEAKSIVFEQEGINIILLDVVMENDHAGIDVVNYIRKDLENRTIKIVLRTGQPGLLNMSEVEKLDIDKYENKANLTSDKLKKLIDGFA